MTFGIITARLWGRLGISGEALTALGVSVQVDRPFPTRATWGLAAPESVVTVAFLHRIS